MALWTTISNALVAVGAKPFATTIQALRDNPVAISEGSPGAPRIKFAALGTIAAGNDIRSRSDAVKNTSSTSGVTFSGFSFLQPGTVRVYAEHAAIGGGTCTMEFVRVRGDTTTVLGSWGTGSSTPTARTLDATVIPGDRINVTARTSNASFTARVQNVRFSIDSTVEPTLWPGLGTDGVEGNP